MIIPKGEWTHSEIENGISTGATINTINIRVNMISKGFIFLKGCDASVILTIIYNVNTKKRVKHL